MTYTLKEKLEQLRDTEGGGAFPPFITNTCQYVDDLRQLAKEALEEITKLEKMITFVKND